MLKQSVSPSLKDHHSPRGKIFLTWNDIALREMRWGPPGQEWNMKQQVRVMESQSAAGEDNVLSSISSIIPHFSETEHRVFPLRGTQQGGTITQLTAWWHWTTSHKNHKLWSIKWLILGLIDADITFFFGKIYSRKINTNINSLLWLCFNPFI